jgi:hypothetical protein
MIETQQKHQAGDTIITGKEVVNVERRHKIIATKLNMHRLGTDTVRSKIFNLQLLLRVSHDL